jgi:hypothetical protein
MNAIAILRQLSPVGSRQERIPTLSQYTKGDMVQKFSRDRYEDFVRQKRAAAVHFDTDWDVGFRPIARRKMSAASEVLGEEVNFGEIDWDREVELVMAFRVIAVPTAYDLDGNLVGGPTRCSTEHSRALRSATAGRPDRSRGRARLRCRRATLLVWGSQTSTVVNR